LQASLVERQTPPRPREKPVGGGSSSSRLAVPHFFLFYAFSFLPYLRIPAADTRLSNSGEDAGCISRTNLKQSVSSSHFRVPVALCVIHIYTQM